MKKKLSIYLILLPILSYSQGIFNFTFSNSEYQDLTTPTVISGNTPWLYDFFGPISIPFNFSINGEVINAFSFDDDYFVFSGPNSDLDTYEGVYFIDSSSAMIQDRTYSTGVSSSPISYKIEGNAGNRILKIQVKNAGLENYESLGLSENFLYVNYQIWLFESNKSIEIRYGSNNITNFDWVNDGDPILAGISNDSLACFASGNIANPAYGEYNETTLPEDLTLSNFPSQNSVFRFTPATAANVQNKTVNLYKVYPNPANDFLFIRSNDSLSHNVRIVDLYGHYLYDENLNPGITKIDLNQFQSGMYLVLIENNSYKILKK